MLIKPKYPNPSKVKSANHIWNMVSISEGFIFSKNPLMATAICYFPPLYQKSKDLLSEQQLRFVRSFFSLPVDSYVGAYLLKYPRNSKILSITKSPHETINFLENKRVDAFNALASPEYSPFISISVPIQVKSKGGLLAMVRGKALDLSDPDIKHGFKAATEQIENMVGQLRATYNGSCNRLSSQAVAQFLGLLLNHTTSNNTFDLNSIISSDIFSSNPKGITYYGGNYHACLSIRHDGFPGTAEPDMYNILFDEALKSIPFTIKLALCLPDAAEAKKKANAIVSRIDAYSALLGNMVKDLMVQKERLDIALLDIERESGRLVDVSLTVQIWAPTEEELEMRIKTFCNVLRSKELALKRDTFNHKATFHGLMPFASHRNSIKTRLPSMNVEPFLPLLFPAFYSNDKTPEVPTYVHSKNDVLMAFDIMDERDPSWNGIVAGQSGSGKSFLTNFLINNHMKSGGLLFIIDKGGPGQGSYRNLILNIPTGRYIELRWIGQTGFTINFFDGPLFFRESMGQIIPDIDGEADAGKENFLLQVLTLMIQEAIGERIPKQEEGHISALLRKAYRDHGNNVDSSLCLDVFCDNYFKAAFPDLYGAMHKFVGDGIYAKFFKSTSNMSGVDCFCFDLEGLEEHKDLAPLLTLVITRFAYDICLNRPGVRKMIVVDEAWAAFKGPLADTIENIWRTIRKHNGFIYCVTQSYEDILKSEISAALITNTTHFFMCGASHNWEALQRLKATGTQTNTITEYDYECIRQLAFKKGEYAEYFFMCPSFKGPIRLRPSSYEYWFSTTNAKDKEKIETVKRQLGVQYVTPQVLERLVPR